MKCYKIDQFFHGYNGVLLLSPEKSRTRFQSPATGRARALGSRSSVRSSGGLGARDNSQGRGIVKSPWSQSRRFSADLTKIHCSGPLGLSPPIPESSTNAPAEGKKKRKNNAETHVYIFYGVSSYKISEPKGTIATPVSLAPPRCIPRAIYSW